MKLLTATLVGVASILFIKWWPSLVAVSSSQSDSANGEFWRAIERCDVDSLQSSIDASPGLANAQRAPGTYALNTVLDKWHGVAMVRDALRLQRCEETFALLLQHTDAEALLAACPLYLAAHYRLVPALKALESRFGPDMSTEELHCVNLRDTHNATALHTVAEAKASGLARVFLNALDLVETHRKTLDLTSMDMPASKRSSIVYSDVVRHTGTQDLEILLRLGANVCTTDRHGRTPAHLACGSGHAVACERVGTMARDKGCLWHRDAYQQTPLHLASAYGFAECVAVLKRLAGNAANWLNQLKSVDMNARTPQMCARSSFHSTLARTLSPSTVVDDDESNSFNIATLNHLPSASVFTRDYVIVGRPLLMRGVAKHWPATGRWTPSNLIRQHGSKHVKVGGIPYASLYGRPSHRCPLHEFIRDEMIPRDKQATDAQTLPRYIFDAGPLARQMALDAPLPASLQHDRPVLTQFMLGPAGSGAPPHFHGHALNGLVFGRKRWFLTPPEYAHFSSLHIQEWMGEKQRHSATLLEFIQEPGDVVFVPRTWGHAVLNMKSSAAMAYEWME